MSICFTNMARMASPTDCLNFFTDAIARPRKSTKGLNTRCGLWAPALNNRSKSLWMGCPWLSAWHTWNKTVLADCWIEPLCGPELMRSAESSCEELSSPTPSSWSSSTSPSLKISLKILVLYVYFSIWYVTRLAPLVIILDQSWENLGSVEALGN